MWYHHLGGLLCGLTTTGGCFLRSAWCWWWFLLLVRAQHVFVHLPKLDLLLVDRVADTALVDLEQLVAKVGMMLSLQILFGEPHVEAGIVLLLQLFAFLSDAFHSSGSSVSM